MNDLFRLGAKEGAQKVRSKQISALDWMESCADRIETVEPAVKAWVYFDREKALSQAKKIDRKDSKEVFCGVPVGVKDIFNTTDMPTCMGSPIWEGFTPGNDARVVFYLRMADAVVAGKTVTAEFAVHTPGKTVNPHHQEYSPGTSSSGSAAAVASFGVPVSLGTQTAGSIVRPASYCGVYGFKPSFGLIPRTAVLKTTDSLDTIGFFARNIEDLELLFEVCRVHGEDYPIADALLSDLQKQSPKGKRWRVGLVTSSLWVWGKMSPYAQEAVKTFANELSKNGILVEELDLPSDFNSAHEIHGTIYDKTLAYYFREEFKKHTLVSKVMYEIITRGNRLTVEQYTQALERQTQLARKLDHLFEKYDVILAPSTAGQAPRLGEDDIPDSCLIWTLCGVPVLNLPFFKSPEKLPFGAQILSRRYQDPLLLKFAKLVEELFPKISRIQPPYLNLETSNIGS